MTVQKQVPDFGMLEVIQQETRKLGMSRKNCRVSDLLSLLGVVVAASDGWLGGSYISPLIGDRQHTG